MRHSLVGHLLLELEDRFDERSNKLLVFMSFFNLENQFVAFNFKKLVWLAQLYHNEFSSDDLLYPKYLLETLFMITEVMKDFECKNS